MTELVEDLVDDTESLYVEGMDCDLESLVSSTTGTSVITGTSVTIVSAPRQRNTPLRSWI